MRYAARDLTLLDLARRVMRSNPRTLAHHAGRVLGEPVRRRRIEKWRRKVTPRYVAHALGLDDPGTLADFACEALWRHFPMSPERAMALRPVLLQRVDIPVAVMRADRVVAHVFDLLGSGPTDLGPSIDWSLDFKSGHRWSQEFYADIAYGSCDDDSDVKVPWELSRGHHLVYLARAWLLTGDETYAKEAGAEFESWLEENPFGWSVNWACTMDVAIRAVNWAWTASVMAPGLTAAQRSAIVAALYQHGLFIAANLERSDVNGNHYLADAVGLVALGAVFGRSSAGRRWLRQGRRIVRAELRNQVHPDGVDHEASVPYHRLVTEFFTVAEIMLSAAGEPSGEEERSILARMAEFIAAYTRTDGSVPVWGDADDGRLLVFGHDDVNDHRHLLSTLGLFLDRPDLAQAAATIHEDSLWLLGPDAASKFDSLAPCASESRGSESFPAGGFIVLRRPDAHVFFDAGPVGLRGRGGHGHNDALSFELWAAGGPIVIDPGAFLYTANCVARNRFRSTRFHNSPQLDELEIADLGPSLWEIADQAQARITDFGERDDDAYAEGMHVGYTRFDPRAIVCRRLVLRDGSLEIFDELADLGRTWRVRMTLDTSLSVADVHDGVRLSREGLEVTITATGARSVRIEPAELSPSYGVSRPTTAVAVEADRSFSWRIEWAAA